MAELFFIATIIFVAYVVFVVLGDKKSSPQPIKSSAAKSEAPKPATPAIQPEKIDLPPVVEVKNSAPAPTTPKAKPAASKPATNTANIGDTLKNPKTGEVAKIPNSYTFAKRWIKDALVEEGLLDKIYKNNELDDATTAKIHQAFEQLKAMEKYQ